jgi:hypothetical protein
MGMNVYGQSPISIQGYYFHGNPGEWEPLWQYCEQLVPGLIPADKKVR